jgi:hypothetical protein
LFLISSDLEKEALQIGHTLSYFLLYEQRKSVIIIPAQFSNGEAKVCGYS